MKTINCIAIDDNISTLNIIEEYLKNIQGFELVGKFTSPIQAGNYLTENTEIDLIFLDIEMPSMTGFEFLKSYKVTQHIIFVTKHKDYAIESFEIKNQFNIEVLDYLLFPVKLDRFIMSCNKAKEKILEKQSFIYLTDNYTKYRIPIDDLILVESDEVDSKYMNFYTRKPVMKDKSPSIFRISLKELEKILPANKFIRINKNCILNTDCINEVRGDDVRISELNKSVNIGDKFKEKIMNFINKRTGK